VVERVADATKTFVYVIYNGAVLFCRGSWRDAKGMSEGRNLTSR